MAILATRFTSEVVDSSYTVPWRFTTEINNLFHIKQVNVRIFDEFTKSNSSVCAPVRFLTMISYVYIIHIEVLYLLWKFECVVLRYSYYRDVWFGILGELVKSMKEILLHFLELKISKMYFSKYLYLHWLLSRKTLVTFATCT